MKNKKAKTPSYPCGVDETYAREIWHEEECKIMKKNKPKKMKAYGLKINGKLTMDCSAYKEVMRDILFNSQPKKRFKTAEIVRIEFSEVKTKEKK